MRMSPLQVCAPCSDSSVLMNEFEAVITYSRKKVSWRFSTFQPRGAKAKSYQVKQVRQVIVRYKMAGEIDEQ